MIRWKRSTGDFVESHDGNWSIVPNYAGCTRPQDYSLMFKNKVVSSMCSTQREAKGDAEYYAERGDLLKKWMNS